MGQREVIDVEALLIRAYREKQVDRRYHADPRSERALSRLILLGYPSVGGGVGGERVDTSPFATKRIAIERELMGEIRFEAEPLMQVHDAVLALPDFFLEPLDGLDFAVWDHETAKAHGHTIEAAQFGGTFSIRAGEHAPRRVTRILPAPLLIRCARSAERPEPSPVVGRRGRAIYDHRKHVAGYETEWDTPLDVVVAERADYAVWQVCLDILALQFRVFLTTLDVQRPSAPVAPWLDTPDVLPIPFSPKKRTRGVLAAPSKLDSAENACA
ncbi:hypothetical protein [Methylobacterium fujisawaense]|uniref:hypothetical protein n=1 Tax=Methylobacterium fujisawaense TaxID=107400 RepID=UPI00313C7C62